MIRSRSYGLIPKHTSRGERACDIFSCLLKASIVYINSPLSDDIASFIVAQLLFLESENPSNGRIPEHTSRNKRIYDTFSFPW